MKKIRNLSRRDFLRISALTAAGAALAACAPAATEPPATEPPAEEPADEPEGEAPAEAPAEEINIEFAHWGPPYEAEFNQWLCDTFMETHPGVTVERNHIPEDFYQKILTLTAGGTPPDVYYSGEAWVWKWGLTGAALDLEPFIQADGIDESIWYEAGVEQLKTPEGQLYGIPTYVGPYMCYYNKDVFDEVGVDYPIQDVDGDWTFDDLRTKAEQIVVVGEGGRTERFMTEPWTHWLHWIPTVRSFGGEILDEAKTSCLLDEPESIEAIQYLADNMLELNIAPSPLVLTEMGQGSRDLILGGKIACWGAGRWGAWSMHDQETDEAFVNWGVAPWPTGVASITPVLFVAFLAHADSAYPDMSWEFIRFTTAEKDIQIEYNASGVGVPILKEAAESRDYLFDYEPASNHDIYARSLERAKALPYHEQWEKTIDTYTVEEFERVWIGEATAEEACVRVAERIDAELTA